MKMTLYAPEEIPEIWQHTEPHFRRVVEKAVHGEFTTDDLKKMAEKGSLYVVLVWEADTVALAMAFEIIRYPRATAANVVAMGGRNMQKAMDAYQGKLAQALRQVGAQWVTCSVSRSMARLCERVGFKTIYQTMRMEL